LAFAASASAAQAQVFPKYDHVFLIIMENEQYGQVIGNPYAPILNGLANDYGLATNYSGVADPSEPNYVAMLGGDPFGINSDDPYWFDDLAAGKVPDFSYIVPDECSDIHGAPPWCVDSNIPWTVQQDWLVANGDKFLGEVVKAITSSSTWRSGNDAIVITFDEGNTATSRVATIVIANHGPRGVRDDTSYNHYSLLASLQKTFGLGCLLKSCTATPMAQLFAVTGATNIPSLPPPYEFPNGSDQISKQGPGVAAAPVSLSGKGWQLEPSYNFGPQDNVLASVSAASASDAWAVGAYYQTATSPLATLAHHFDGKRWTAYPLPNVGAQENVLLAVSMPSPGSAWAVGYYINGKFEQKTLIEHFDGAAWSVVASPSPGQKQNILYGVAAISDRDVWAVGASQNSPGLWRTLAEHWDGSNWSVVDSADPGVNGNQFYAVTARSSSDAFAVGQQAGAGFPSEALIEHWDGKGWRALPTPVDANATALPLGVAATPYSLTVVGQQETDKAPYTTYVAAGPSSRVSIQDSPNSGAGENDLFGAATAADGSTWAVGWDINTKTGNHNPLALTKGSKWSLVSTPSLGGADSGFAAIAAIPGGGLWAVGVTGNSAGNYATLIEYHR
jgi:hypothetical protein